MPDCGFERHPQRRIHVGWGPARQQSGYEIYPCGGAPTNDAGEVGGQLPWRLAPPWSERYRLAAPGDCPSVRHRRDGRMLDSARALLLKGDAVLTVLSAMYAIAEADHIEASPSGDCSEASRNSTMDQAGTAGALQFRYKPQPSNSTTEAPAHGRDVGVVLVIDAGTSADRAFPGSCRWWHRHAAGIRHAPRPPSSEASWKVMPARYFRVAEYCLLRYRRPRGCGCGI